MEKITKLLIILLMVLGVSSGAQAQGWTKTYDKQTTTDAALRLVKTNSGGAVFAGYLSYLIGGGYYLMEVDSLGNELWYQTFTTPQAVTIRSLRAFSTGEVVVMGSMSAGSGNPISTYIAKHDASGARQWFKTYFSVYLSSGAGDLLVLPGDTLLLGGHVFNTSITPNEMEVVLYKLDANGDSVKYAQYSDVDTLPGQLNHLTLAPNGNIIAVGRSSNESPDHTLYGFDSDLNQLWVEHLLLGATNDIFMPHDIIATSDGGYLTTGLELITGQPNGLTGFAYLVKNAADGTLQWIKHFHLAGDVSHGNAIAEPEPGKYTLLAMGLSESSPNTYYSGRPYLVFTDDNGNQLSYKTYTGSTYISLVNMRDIAVMDDKGFLMCGSIGQGVIDQDIHLIRTDSLGNIYKALIMGNVFADANENCQIDGGEQSLKRWVVTATSTVDSFYGITDALGNYEINLDTGTYALKAVVPNAYWIDTLCGDSLTAQVLLSTDTLVKHIAVGKTVDCPALKVSVDAPFLRRCLPGPAYRVSYCNNGTADAPGAYAEITLDSYLLLDSASIAYTSLGNNRYRFDLGTIDVNDCGYFLMHIRVDCGWMVPGSAYCVEADIFPNTPCLPPNPLWDGARLELDTDCQPDSLAFMLRNTGTGNMGALRTFTIIQDDVMYVQGNFQLNSGQVLTHKVPSNGSTWTFITEQTPFFSGNRMLVNSLEGCGVNNTGQFSMGFLMQYPQIGPDETSDALCLVAVGSYDPNDKAPEPQGIGLEGTIDKDQDLTYRIRFQNTGTDTAFLVVILDTLSPNLNPATIRNIRSSHDMEVDILRGNILQFVFPNILLPDSNVNEPASHGFVSFDIDLVSDLPNGTEITNTAFIYFDRNPAIVTNTVLNTIGELYKTWLSVTELVNPDNRVSFYPNPTQGMLHFSIEGNNADAVEVVVFDIQGRQMLQRQFRPGQPLQMDVAELSTGTYLMQVRTNGYTGIYRIVVAH